MSGAVGSIPSFTRNGRPSLSLRSSSPSGSTLTACRVSSVGNSFEVLDLNRLELVRGLEAEDLSEEREMRLQRAFDVLGLAEAVALSLEGDVRVRDAASGKRRHDHLGLGGQDDLVVEPLQEQQGMRDRVGVVDRRALAVQVGRLRPRGDQVFVVMRFELVRIVVEGNEV